MSLEAFISGRSSVTPGGALVASSNPPVGGADGNGNGTDGSGGGGGGGGGATVLAERTSQLMSSYRDYISGQEDEEMMMAGAGGGGGGGGGASAAMGGMGSAGGVVGIDSSGMHNRSPSGAGGGVGGGGGGGSSSDAPLLREWNSHGSFASRTELDVEELTYDDDGCYGKKYRYHHPIYRTKKFKGFLLTVAVAGAIIGTTMSVVKRKREARLPDWDEELKEVLGETEERKDPLLHVNAGIAERPPGLGAEDTKPVEAVAGGAQEAAKAPR
jgi:hypothetical protein